MGDPYADIDFDEITENTGLQPDEIKCLKVSRIFFFLNGDDNKNMCCALLLRQKN